MTLAFDSKPDRHRSAHLASGNRRILGVLVGLAAVMPGVASATDGGTADAAAVRSTVPQQPRKVLVAQLVGKILAISRLTPMKIERAVEVLGSRLGPEQHPTPYVTAWSLAPTPLVAGATATRLPDGDVVQLTPHPSLELAFQDFEKALLDLPYYLHAQPRHTGEDSVAIVVRTVYHIFRVKAGELLFEVPSGISEEAPNQIEAALYKGFDSAEAKDRLRIPIQEIRISSAIIPRWEGAPSLRKLRRKK